MKNWIYCRINRRVCFLRSGGRKEKSVSRQKRSYAPFETVNEKNEIVGFDVDLAPGDVCQNQCGMHLYQPRAFDSLIPSLEIQAF